MAKIRVSWGALATVVVVFVSIANAAPPQPPLELTAQAIARELQAGRGTIVASRFNADMAKAVTAAQLDELVRTLAGGRAVAGEPTVKQIGPTGPLTQFVARLTWASGPASEALIVLGTDGKIAGLRMRPEQAAVPGADRYDGYTTKAALKLPFAGTWTALNAARASTNAHFTNANQRFAVDWIMRGPDGKNVSRGKEALAVAAATVVTVIDGVPENEPGKTDHYNVTGNSVVLDLGGGEWALYAHLVPGSIKVKPGQRVTVGQVLGQIGNSGNSSEAHLHFQLMNAPRLTDAAALPAPFSDVTVGGKRVPRALPDEGQTFSP